MCVDVSDVSDVSRLAVLALPVELIPYVLFGGSIVGVAVL